MLAKDHRFRWVDCQLDTLRACNKVSAIKTSLDQLPATLDETYERILRAIEPADTVEAYNILQWLAFAERPLTLEEVAEAAVTKEDGGPIDPEDRLFDPYDVVRICKGLVSITEDKLAICGRWTAGKFVRFAHFSVKEYLLSSRVLEGTAKTFHMVTNHSHQQIGRSCLSILLQNDEISKLQHLPLVKYAAQFWVKHLCKYESDAKNTAAFKPLIEKLVGDSPKAFQNWLFVYDVNIGQGHDAASSQRPSSPPSPLYYAAFLGLEHAIRMLLKSGVDINAYGGRYGTALIAAATQGNSAAVSILLDHDANVDAKGGYTFYTALQASSFFGFTSVVRMLLDGGAQPDRRRAKDDTALELACEAGHGSIVELLISRGSDVNLHAGGYVSETSFLPAHTILPEAAKLIPINSQKGVPSIRSRRERSLRRRLSSAGKRREGRQRGRSLRDGSASRCLGRLGTYRQASPPRRGRCQRARRSLR